MPSLSDIVIYTDRFLRIQDGSVAANWIEADEALSKKDFLMRVKICRKEAKESRLFLRLLDVGLMESTLSARDQLAVEVRELTLIFLRLSRRVDNRANFLEFCD